MTTLSEFLNQRRGPVYNDVGKDRFELHQLQIDVEQVLSSFDDLPLELIETKLAEWRDKVEEVRELTAPSGWLSLRRRSALQH